MNFLLYINAFFKWHLKTNYLFGNNHFIDYGKEKSYDFDYKIHFPDDCKHIYTQVDGNIYVHWIKNNMFHRQNGPAVACLNNSLIYSWCIFGARHRDDGPAISYYDHWDDIYKHKYYQDGIEVDEADFILLRKQRLYTRQKISYSHYMIKKALNRNLMDYIFYKKCNNNYIC